MIRTQSVRLQDVDKPIEVAKLFNEVFQNLRDLDAKLSSVEQSIVSKKKKSSERKDKT